MRIQKIIELYKNNSFFTKILVLFIGVISSCVFILGYNTYIYFSDVLKNEIYNSNETTLYQTQYIVDQRYESMKDIVKQIGLDSRVEKTIYYTGELEPNDTLVHKDIIQHIRNIQVSNEFVENIWIYFKRSNMIISGYGKHSKELFFDEVYPYSINKDTKERLEEGISFGFSELVESEERESVLTYSASLPIGSLLGEAKVNIDIKADIFTDLMKVTNKDRPVYMSIRDISNKSVGKYTNNIDEELIVGIESYLKDRPRSNNTNQQVFEQVSIFGKAYMIGEIISDTTGYQFISILPISYIEDKLKVLRVNTLLTCLVVLVIGSIFTLIFVRRIYQPINRIVDYIKIVSGSKKNRVRDEIGLIDKFIEFTYKENKQLKNTLNNTEPIIHKKILEDILDGRINKDMFYKEYNSVRLVLNKGMYQVICFEIQNVEEIKYNRKLQEFIKVVTDEMINTDIQYYLIEKRKNMIVALINLE